MDFQPLIRIRVFAKLAMICRDNGLRCRVSLPLKIARDTGTVILEVGDLHH
jgi:hypothetical protein